MFSVCSLSSCMSVQVCLRKLSNFNPFIYGHYGHHYWASLFKAAALQLRQSNLYLPSNLQEKLCLSLQLRYLLSCLIAHCMTWLSKPTETLHIYIATFIIQYNMLDVEIPSPPCPSLCLFCNLNVCSYDTTYYPVDLYH